MLRFTFAEASVNLAEAFPGLDLCNGAKAFVQVRTRSSASSTSDLKDTTKIFGFNFGGPEAVATLAANCSAQFTYSSAGSKDSSGGSNLGYSWDFTVPTGISLSGTGITGPDAGGAYHSTSASGTIQVTHPAGVNTATVSAKLTVTQGGTTACTTSTETSVNVLRPLEAVPSASTGCLAQFSFDGTGSSGGTGFSYSWDFTPPTGVSLSGSDITGPDANGIYHATSSNGTVNVSLPAGVDSAAIGLKLSVNLGDCTASATTSTTVLRPVASALQLGLNCLPQFTFANAGSTAGSGVTYSWSFTPPVGVTLGGTGITGPDANGVYHATSASGAVDVSLPAGVNSASVFARLITTRGACTATAEGSVTVLRALTAAITQKIANGTNSAVGLTGAAATATSLQWQRQAADGAWLNIPGATTGSLTYSSFENDSAPTFQAFNIDGTTYQGKLFQVQLRVHAERSVGGILCTADSAPVTLKKVIAVDP